MNIISNFILISLVFTSCKRSVENSDPKVAFSEPVTQEDFSKAVPIWIVKKHPNCPDNERIVVSCSGTRISNLYLTTAGHCMDKAEEAYVWHDFTKAQELIPIRAPNKCRPLLNVNPVDAIRVDTSHIASNYDTNDLAVLRVEGMTQKIIEPIPFSELPDKDVDFVAYGFGGIDCYKYVNVNGQYQTRIVPESSTRLSFGKATYRGKLNVNKLGITIQAKGRAHICPGDSGSGALVQMENQPERMYGVVTAMTNGLSDGKEVTFAMVQILSSAANCNILRGFKSLNQNFIDLNLEGFCANF